MALGGVVGAGLCRTHWANFSRLAKINVPLGGGSFIAVYVFMAFSGWGFTSALANELVGSIAVGGYTLLALLMTRFRPKPLAYCLAIILLLPVPVALLWLPLLAHSQGPIVTEHISGTLFVEKVRWDAGAMGSSGTTLIISDKPRFVPFVEHRFRKINFNDTVCLSRKAFVVLQPDARHVLARCPWPEYQHKDGFHDFLVPLY